MSTQMKVLVVGTTPDYIDWLRKSAPDKALFLTDTYVRRQAAEEVPAAIEEIVCDLDNYQECQAQLQSHLQKYDLGLAGVVAYDCESLEMAALLAEKYRLSYPSPLAVRNCRDKSVTKQLWQQKGVNCPRSASVDLYDPDVTESGAFIYPCVVKPCSGSGSELVFICRNDREFADTCRILKRELYKRRGHRMYDHWSDRQVLVEEYIEGKEYSCDFIIDGEDVQILRFTGKVHEESGVFGTTLAYRLQSCTDAGLDHRILAAALHRAARVLGVKRSVCMVDFIVRDGEVVLLEMTPRPGGDCLPHLLECAVGLDVITRTLDFFGGQSIAEFSSMPVRRYAGLRLFAATGGEVDAVETASLCLDARVRKVDILYGKGHRVKMPPEDYESRLLGHVIFDPAGEGAFEQQCQELRGLLKVEMKQ